jgi:uncharacterized protein (DUF488 family)
MNTIYTIGYGNRKREALLAELKAHGVTCVVDIRAYPWSSHNPQYKLAALKEWLAAAGIDHKWVKGLGNPAYLDREPFAKALPESSDAQDALEYVLQLAKVETVVLMCSEADWRTCHRTEIGIALEKRGATVRHIGPPARPPMLLLF